MVSCFKGPTTPFFLPPSLKQASLAKFCFSVRWEYPEQVSQAMELLQTWPAVAPESVLELLTRTFPHSVCRRFAVSRLKGATDEVSAPSYFAYLYL